MVMGAMQAPTKKKLPGVGNIDGHVAMHGMLAQQVDAELFPGLREAKLAVECKDIGEDAPALSVMNKFQEFLRKRNAWRIKPTV